MENLVISQQVRQLFDRKVELEQELKNVRVGIETLQSLCTHKKEDGTSAFKYDSHDSHYDYYECSICKQIRRE